VAKLATKYNFQIFPLQLEIFDNGYRETLNKVLMLYWGLIRLFVTTAMKTSNYKRENYNFPIILLERIFETHQRVFLSAMKFSVGRTLDFLSRISLTN
jgi:hypothetical protein